MKRPENGQRLESCLVGATHVSLFHASSDHTVCRMEQPAGSSNGSSLLRLVRLMAGGGDKHDSAHAFDWCLSDFESHHGKASFGYAIVEPNIGQSLCIQFEFERRRVWSRFTNKAEELVRS